MMRCRRLFVLLVPVAATMIAACVGDAPDTGITPTDDGGSSADATTTDSPPGADAAGPIADGASEDANDAAHPFDAGPPAWTATLVAGTVTTLGSAGDARCAFDLVSVQLPLAGPPVFQIYLRKQDAAGGMCNEPKGIRSLGSGYSAPTGSLIRPQGTQHLVLAYSSKIGQSGSSPIQLRMSQVDWPSGNDIHVALMKTKAVVGIPATPSLSVTQLFFGDPTEEAAGTVRLKGTGAFPGESGAGGFFFATYVGFIKAVDQLPVAADTCTRSD